MRALRARLTSKSWFTVVLILGCLVVLTAPAGAQQLSNGNIVNTIVQKYEAESANWAQTILNEAKYVFCVLAGISLAWTAGLMALRRADFMEIVAEIMRFIMVTSFFYWLMIAGPALAQDIIRSLQALGDSAANVDGLPPATIINLGLKVFSNGTTQLLNLFAAGLGVGTFILAAVVMFTCALIGINMVVLLCSAWVLMYAGIIILGFGGCRWTSEMAINYYRAVLAIGLKLMVMTLIVGIGVNLLQGEIDSLNTWNLMNLAVVAISALVLLLLSHQLPNMAANIVFGGATHGAVANMSGIAMLVMAQQIGTAVSRAVTGATRSGSGGAGGRADALKRAVQNGQQTAAQAASNGSRGTGSAGMSPPPLPQAQGASSSGDSSPGIQWPGLRRQQNTGNAGAGAGQDPKETGPKEAPSFDEALGFRSDMTEEEENQRNEAGGYYGSGFSDEKTGEVVEESDPDAAEET